MKKKVLVVDDSALMRKHLRTILQEAGYEVEAARNGEEALAKVHSWDPDVVTLDINMPVMDGLTCLSHMMEECPKPVVMVSSLTEKGALVTFEALELGAFDYVAKPGGTVSLNIDEVSAELLRKVRAASRARIGKSLGLRQRLRSQRRQIVEAHEKRKPKAAGTGRDLRRGYSLVLVGVSTGGPSTLDEIFRELPGDFPLPVVVAQHMPARFTRVFAERLNKISFLEVLEVSRPTPLESGRVYIGRGDADVVLVKRGTRLLVSSVPADDAYLWHPSVERLVRSVAELCDPRSVICVQLTGMGHDGAEGMAALHAKGARTIAESEETAVVYGMPRELVDRGGAEEVLPFYRIAQRLVEWVC